MPPTRQAVLDLCRDHFFSRQGQSPNFRVVQNHSSALSPVDHVFQCQAGVVGAGVVINRRRPQAFGAQARYQFERRFRVEHAVTVRSTEVAEQVINGEPKADLKR